MSIKYAIKEKGFVSIQLPQDTIIYDIVNLLETRLKELLAIENTQEYHIKLVEMQSIINKMATRDKLIDNLRDKLIDFHGSSTIGVQTIVRIFVRAACFQAIVNAINNSPEI